MNVKTIAVHTAKMNNGGVEKNTSNLLYLWDKMGLQSILLTEYDRCEDDYPYPKEVIRVGLPSTQNRKWRDQVIEDTIKQYNVDVYIDNGWMSEELVSDLEIVKGHCGIPFVVYTHSNFSVLYRYIESSSINAYKYFKDADCILALDTLSKRFYELNGCKTALVRNPVSENNHLDERKKIDFNEIHIAWIGRMSEEKRPLEAMKMFLELNKKNDNYIMDVYSKNEGSIYREVFKFCKDNGILDKVIFHGYVKDIADIYKTSDAVIMTSQYEGYPISLIESKSFGIPTIMYELPYLAVLEDGLGYKSVAQGDYVALAKAVEEIFENAEIYNSYATDVKKSFENILAYDYEGDWNNVFELCEKDSGTVYTEESDMFNMLFNQLSFGINNNISMRIGRKMLKIPRLIKKIRRERL